MFSNLPLRGSVVACAEPSIEGTAQAFAARTIVLNTPPISAPIAAGLLAGTFQGRAGSRESPEEAKAVETSRVLPAERHVAQELPRGPRGWGRSPDRVTDCGLTSSDSESNTFVKPTCSATRREAWFSRSQRY